MELSRKHKPTKSPVPPMARTRQNPPALRISRSLVPLLGPGPAQPSCSRPVARARASARRRRGSGRGSLVRAAPCVPSPMLAQSARCRPSPNEA